MEYRTKSQRFRAVQVAEIVKTLREDVEDLPSWILDLFHAGRIVASPTSGSVEIRHTEGHFVRCNDDGWVILLATGFLFTSSANVFDVMYEEA
jgi:hypothetical protein